MSPKCTLSALTHPCLGCLQNGVKRHLFFQKLREFHRLECNEQAPTSTGPRHVIMRDKKARSSENPAGYPFFDSGNIGGKLCYSQLIFPGGLASGARKCHRTTNDSEGDTKSLNQHPLQMFASATASIHPKNTQIGHYGEKLFLGGCF